MARSEKYFDIPRGNEAETDDIRQALIDKIKQQEKIGQEQAKFAPRTQAQYQAQAPAATPQPQQNIPNMQPQQPVSNPQTQVQGAATNSYANYGSYSSPFAEVNENSAPNNNLIDAIHSKEPVKYKPKKRKSAAKTFLLLVLMIAIIFGLSWALREFVFQAYEIPSGSMEETIMTGDMVFAEKISPRISSPKAGDIVTFMDPQNDGRILIKRVIATAGQEVDIKNNKLYIDGVEQNEDYVNGARTTPLNRSNIKYPYIVPDDSVWVMGDNRTNSQDSRSFGAIPTSSVVGHALFVYWPYEDWKAF